MSGPLTAVHRGVLMSVIAVFRVEIFFAHNEQENALNEAHNAGYACPAEEQIDNAPSNPAQIEFMYAKAAEKNGEECRSKLLLPFGARFPRLPGKGGGDCRTPHFGHISAFALISAPQEKQYFSSMLFVFMPVWKLYSLVPLTFSYSKYH